MVGVRFVLLTVLVLAVCEAKSRSGSGSSSRSSGGSSWGKSGSSSGSWWKSGSSSGSSGKSSSSSGSSGGFWGKLWGSKGSAKNYDKGSDVDSYDRNRKKILITSINNHGTSYNDRKINDKPYSQGVDVNLDRGNGKADNFGSRVNNRKEEPYDFSALSLFRKDGNLKSRKELENDRKKELPPWLPPGWQNPVSLEHAEFLRKLIKSNNRKQRRRQRNRRTSTTLSPSSTVEPDVMTRAPQKSRTSQNRRKEATKP